MDEPPPLGERLRQVRRSYGITLEEAAGRSGISLAHLSRLETGRRRPSLPALLSLARCYATTVSHLLGEDAADAEPVVRAAAAEPVHAHGWTYRRAGSPRRGMQALRVRVPPGTADGAERVHPGEEWIYVLSGTLLVMLDGVAHRLGPHDAAHFDSGTPHRMQSADPAAPAEFLMMHAAPSLVAFSPCLPDVPAR